MLGCSHRDGQTVLDYSALKVIIYNGDYSFETAISNGCTNNTK